MTVPYLVYPHETSKDGGDEENSGMSIILDMPLCVNWLFKIYTRFRLSGTSDTLKKRFEKIEGISRKLALSI